MEGLSGDALSAQGNTFYKLGWFGLTLVLIFNFGFFLLYFIDIVNMFRFTNR